MKRCTQEHTAAGFGTIPVGSLWADDSPYVIDADMFEPVDADEVPEVEKPKRKPPARKFGEKGGD